MLKQSNHFKKSSCVTISSHNILSACLSFAHFHHMSHVISLNYYMIVLVQYHASSNNSKQKDLSSMTRFCSLKIWVHPNSLVSSYGVIINSLQPRNIYIDIN